MINTVENVRDRLLYFKDPGFVYTDETHSYTYGGRPYTSATQFIEKLHKPFDGEYWSKTKAFQEGVSQEVILKRWADKAKKSQVMGTNVHQYIENYFNSGALPEVEDRGGEEKRKIEMFRQLVLSGFFQNLVSIGSEIKVFSKKYPIAGTLDQLFLNTKDSGVYIFDWKSNEEFKTRAYGNLYAPFNKIPDITVNKYSVQLSIYDTILGEAGIDIAGRYIIHMGPEIAVYNLPDLKQEVILAFKKLKNNEY